MSLVADVAIGMAAGNVGVKALTATSTVLYTLTPETILRQEQEIESEDPFVLLAHRLAEVFGVELSGEMEDRWVRRLDMALGAGMGVAYVMAARRWPLGWFTGGATLGALYFLLMDEGLGPALGLVGNNRAYPWQSHARGLAAHTAFGIAAGAVGALLGVRGNKR